MTTPILEELSDSDDAPSTLILWTPGGGGLQLDGGTLAWLKSHVTEQTKSLILFLVKCQTCIGGSPWPS